MHKTFGRGKNSVSGLSNAGNQTTLSMPQLLKSNSKKSTNIVIKGAFATKPAAKTTSKKAATKKTSTSKKDKSSGDLMEKLLSEITSKYKDKLCKDQSYLQRLEKKTMI